MSELGEMSAFGERAVRFAIAPDVSRRALFGTLRSLAGVVDVVLAETVGLVVVDETVDRERLVRTITMPSSDAPDDPTQHRIEVVYDGEDLDAVAHAIGGTRDDVVRLHAEREYRVAMLGFLPGFAYLRGLPEALQLPRRAPRPRVPRGAVAIGGGYAGVYPFASPGGWHLLGRAASFEPFVADRALFALGDVVRFTPVGSASPSAMPSLGELSPPHGPHLEVTRIAGLALFVDGGRPGRMHEGIPAGGPLVRSQYRRANALLENDDAACTIELSGTLEVVAVGDTCVVADEARAISLAAGERHVFASTGRRVRYVALSGGVDRPIRLGGRGDLLVAGIGRPLRRGDRFGARPTPRSSPTKGAEPDAPESSGAIPILPGPDVVPGFDMADLTAGDLRVSASSDRTGTRLEGLAVALGREALSRPSAPMIRGAIELTPAGPVVLGPDHPTTGGYPVVAVVTERGLDRLFSRPIGGTVRLELAPDRVRSPALW